MDLVTPAGLEKLTAELVVLRSKREAFLEGLKAGAGIRGPAAEHLDPPIQAR